MFLFLQPNMRQIVQSLSSPPRNIFVSPDRLMKRVLLFLEGVAKIIDLRPEMSKVNVFVFTHER